MASPAVTAWLLTMAPGFLYICSSLVLGIQLNLLGPSASSLANSLGVTEAALGPVMGIGGIGLLLGGMPSGWLLDRYPGHAVLTAAMATQAACFAAMAFSPSILLLGVFYASASLTFNCVTTGCNALIIWAYPVSHGSWLNLASSLFGVGCFLSPCLARLAAEHGTGSGAEAFYITALLAAACSAWAACIHSPLPPRPRPGSRAASLAASRQPSFRVPAEARVSTTPAAATAQARSRPQSRSTAREEDARAPCLLPAGSVDGSASMLSPLLPPQRSGNGVAGTASDDDAVPLSVPAAAAAAGTAASGTPASSSCCTKCGGVNSGVSSNLTASPTNATVSSAASAGHGYGAVSPVLPALGQTPAPTTAAAGPPGSDGGAAVPPAATGGGSDAVADDERLSLTCCDTPIAAAVAAALLQAEPPPATHFPCSCGSTADACLVDDLHVAEAPGLTKYMHELRDDWQVLLPVVLMLFANISIQASCGAWMYTYALRHVGLSPPDAQAVTALYWAAFTATRLVGVGAARVLHASSIMLITTPAALAGAAAALWGLPGGMDVDAFGHVHGLGGDVSMGMAGLPVGLSTRNGAGMALPSLPRSLLMQAQPLPGMQAALLGTNSSSGGMSMGSGRGMGVQPGVHEVRLLYGVVVLVGVGVATGFANAVSMTADYIVLDGFINGILSTVAGLASALCPAAVPWLAQQGGRSPWLGWQSLMWVTLAMATLQLIFTLATLTAGCVHRRALARRRAEARGQVISTGGQQASQHRHHQQRQVHVQHGEGQRQGHGSGLLPCPAPMAPRPYGASGSRCSGGRGSPPGGGLQAAGAGHSTSTGAGSSGSGGKPAQRQTAAAVVICSGGGRSPLGAVGGGRGAAAGYGHSPLSRPLLQVDLS